MLNCNKMYGNIHGNFSLVPKYSISLNDFIDSRLNLRRPVSFLTTYNFNFILFFASSIEVLLPLSLAIATNLPKVVLFLRTCSKYLESLDVLRKW